MTTLFSRVKDIPDEEYHKQSSLEEHFFSSSQLKTAKNNLKQFHREVVEGNKKSFSPVTMDAFTVGHYFHAHYLEPHTLKDYAIWDAPKRGKAWVDFQKENEGKRILSQTMLRDSKILIEGVESSFPCKEQLAKPFGAEESFFAVINGLRVKCRFDILHEYDDHAIGGDLKSTAEENLESPDVLRKTISKLGYALSYALYRDVYEAVTGKPMKGWYWIFSSKKSPNAKLVWASEEYYLLGRQQYMEGLEKIKQLREDKWEYLDKAITLTPAPYEMGKISIEEDI